MHAIAVNKDDFPNDWPKKGGAIYRKATTELLDEIMKDTPGRITVIFDPNTALTNNHGCRQAQAMADKYDRTLVRCDQDTSSSDEKTL